MRAASEFVDVLLGDRTAFQKQASEGSFVMRSHIDPSDVLTWDELNRVLNYTGVPQHLVKDGIRTNDVTSEQMLQQVPAGGTIQLESLAPYSPRLAAIAGELEVALGGEQVDVNVYLAPSKDHSAFATHHDVVDVFVIQISGTKRWQVFEPVIIEPVWFLKNHKYEVDDNRPVLDVVLAPGDVLYMRRGDPHNVRCVGDEPSLHVNLRVIPTTRKVFLDWLVQEAAEQEMFRTAIPYALAGEDVTVDRLEWVERMAADFSAWLAASDPRDLLERYFNERTAKSIPPMISLPDLVLGPPSTFGPASSVRLAHPQLRARMSGTALFAGGHEIELPEDLIAPVKTLISHPTDDWPVAELAAMHGLSAERVCLAMKELLKVGVVRRSEV